MCCPMCECKSPGRIIYSREFIGDLGIRLRRERLAYSEGGGGSIFVLFIPDLCHLLEVTFKKDSTYKYTLYVFVAEKF